MQPRSVFMLGAAAMLSMLPFGTVVAEDAATRAIERHDESVETRPLNVRKNPPSLSERATGVESSIPMVVQRKIDGDPELRTQHIKVAGNERRNITLSGEVTIPRLKRKAQDLAQSVSGVQHVHNDIVVLGTAGRSGSDAATTDRSDPGHFEPQRE